MNISDASYSKAVKQCSTIAEAMALLGEFSECSVTCCFEGGVLYIEPHANDLDGNGLTIAIAAGAATASISEGQ